MKLFCFPHAGGFANFYTALSQCHFNNIDEVLVYEYSGRGTRFKEKEANTFEECVDIAVSYILERTEDNERLTLFGHSMGAFVAYEAAERLRRLRRRIDVVFLSGQKPPCYVESEYYATDIDRLYPFLKKLGGVPEFVEKNEEFREYFFSLTLNDMKLLRTYCPTFPAEDKLPCCVLMYGNIDAELSGIDVNLWNKNFEKINEIRIFEGNHFYLSNYWEEISEFIDEKIRKIM